METKVYEKIARCQDARLRCIGQNNKEWIDNHYITIEDIIKEYFPHGSGLDYNYFFDYEKSMAKKEVLYFYTSFHTMDTNGYYDGIIDFTITVKPSLQFRFDLDIKGNFGKRQDIKDYLHETFDYALSSIIKD